MKCSFCKKEVENPIRARGQSGELLCCSDPGCQDDLADYLDFGMMGTSHANLPPATRFPAERKVSGLATTGQTAR